jgi:simple sugar transport system permease protein
VALGAAIGGVFEGYGAMLSGAIGDPGRIVAALQSGDPKDIANAIRPISETLVNTTPFIFVSLGLVVSFRAGLFNLGADGQFFIGGVGATLTVSLVAGQLPPFLALVAGLAGGFFFGAAYGFVPGFLKARTGAHEVITTLMLNSIAPAVVTLMFSLAAFGGSPAPFPRVPVLLDLPAIRVDWGFVAALLTAAAVSFFLHRTTLGLELRASGFNRTAANSAGMRPGRSMVLAMALSGALAGLGSAFLALGPAGQVGFVRDLGYISLALALLAGLRPSGVVLAAALYGALNNGAKSMVIATGIPLALLTFIIAVAVMFVAAPGLIRSLWRLGPAKRHDLMSARSVGPADST